MEYIFIALLILLMMTALGSGFPVAFALPGSDGKTHQLDDHLGKRSVVLAWFPKAFTPG